MQSFRIGKNEAGQRLDKYLKKLLPEASDGFRYKMLRKKNITLNGKKADGSEKLALGDEVKLFFSEETFRIFSGKAAGEQELSEKYPCIPLTILYEDEDILAIDKPAGMLSQKAAPSDLSANEYIIGYLLAQGTVTAESLGTFRPSVCSRLDRNTSGILVAGKSLKGLQDMAAQLQGRAVGKYYVCLAKGLVREQVCLEGWLVKDGAKNRAEVFLSETPGGKYMKASYRPLAHFFAGEKGELGAEAFTLLEARLTTGRSHQIRVQLADFGHPIVGDAKYGDREVNRRFWERLRLTSQLLHAWRMELADGRKICAPPDERFREACRLASAGGKEICALRPGELPETGLAWLRGI